MRSIPLTQRLALIALLLGAAASCGGSDGPAGPDGEPSEPSISMTLSPRSLTIRQAESAELSVTVSRSGGFDGAVSVGISGLPPGVSAAPATIDADATSADLVVAVAASAATGPDRATVRAGGPGVSTVSQSLALEIRSFETQGSVSVTR